MPTAYGRDILDRSSAQDGIRAGDDEDDGGALNILNCLVNNQISLDTMSSDGNGAPMGAGTANTRASTGDGAGSAAAAVANFQDYPTPSLVDSVMSDPVTSADDSPTKCSRSTYHQQSLSPDAAAAGDIEGAAALDAATSFTLNLDDGRDDEDERKLNSLSLNMCGTGWDLLHVVYLSLFTTVGVTMRAFMGRFFGGDCESNAMGHTIDDFLWPVSHKICITANGRTEQYGGALFIDLPANMFGSFIMGYYTGHSVDWPAMPCLSHDHPLQEEKGLHVGLKTALCGSLTTFSSWNSQMVLMMDGTANPYLGSQILAAVFGYLLGLQAALVSFRAGRTYAAWIHSRRNPYVFDSTLDKHQTRRRWHHNYISRITPVIVFICIGGLVSLYVLGDFYWGISYYRSLWIACLAAPIGTILRWKLGTLNGKFSFRGTFWFPTGTFLANFLGSILSAGLQALAIIESANTGSAVWKMPVIKAISLGVAGSLSTVSTFAKECVDIGEKSQPFEGKQFLYSHGTIVSCCLVGLIIYCPLVRSA